MLTNFEIADFIQKSGMTDTEKRIALARLDSCSHGEIKTELGLSQGNYKRAMRNIRHALKEILLEGN